MILCFFLLLVSAQLESLSICISLDYLMTLQDFFISGLPTASTPTTRKVGTIPILNSENQISTNNDQSTNENNQLKVERRLSRTLSTSQKVLVTPAKRIFSSIIFLSI